MITQQQDVASLSLIPLNKVTFPPFFITAVTGQAQPSHLRLNLSFRPLLLASMRQNS